MRVRPTARNGERFTPPSMTFCLLTCSLILTFLAAFCVLPPLYMPPADDQEELREISQPPLGQYWLSMLLSSKRYLQDYGVKSLCTARAVWFQPPCDSRDSSPHPNHKSDKTSEHFNGGRGTPLQTLRTPRKFQKCLLTVFCSHQRAPFFPPPLPITVADNRWLQTSRRTIFPQRTSLTLLPTLHNLTELQFTCLCAMDT